MRRQKASRFPDNRPLTVTRLDKFWISAKRDGIFYEFNRQDGTLWPARVEDNQPPDGNLSTSQQGRRQRGLMVAHRPIAACRKPDCSETRRSRPQCSKMSICPRDHGRQDGSRCLLVVAAPIKRPYIWDLAPSASPIRYHLSHSYLSAAGQSAHLGRQEVLYVFDIAA